MWFFVRGKGNKLGKIPVNDQLLEIVRNYRNHLRYPSPEPTPEETTPLIISWTTGNSLTTRQMNKMLKSLALKTAEQFKDNPEKQQKLSRFSAHWLRHLSATMQDRAGIAFKHIRANHRHEKDNTTRLYVHALDKERHVEMQKLTFMINANESKEK